MTQWGPTKCYTVLDNKELENYFIAVNAVVLACKNINLITSRRRSSKRGSSTGQSFQAVSTTTLPHHGGSTTHGRYFCNIWCIFRHFPAARTRSASSPEPPKPHSEATQLSAGFQETNSPNTKHPHTAYAFTYAFLLLSQRCSKIKAQFHIQKYPLQLLSLIPMSCFDACICVHVLI